MRLQVQSPIGCCTMLPVSCNDLRSLGEIGPGAESPALEVTSHANTTLMMPMVSWSGTWRFSLLSCVSNSHKTLPRNPAAHGTAESGCGQQRPLPLPARASAMDQPSYFWMPVLHWITFGLHRVKAHYWDGGPNSIPFKCFCTLRTT